MKTKLATLLFTLFSFGAFCQPGDFALSISYSYDQNFFTDDQMDLMGFVEIAIFDPSFSFPHGNIDPSELPSHNFSINFAFQQRVAQNFFLESGLTYVHVDQNFYSNTYYGRSNIAKFKNRDVAIPILANVDVHFKPLSIYLGVGMNAALKMKWEHEENPNNFSGFNNSLFENSYQLGSIVQAGTHINLANQMQLKIGGRYLYSFANQNLNSLYRLSAEAGLVFVLE